MDSLVCSVEKGRKAVISGWQSTREAAGLKAFLDSKIHNPALKFGQA
ncbi:hypothetical protein [Paracoccus gahaiensis]|nr:hypothetical protein [Paracoccus gahaiensis]